jgi:hypothetical protein
MRSIDLHNIIDVRPAIIPQVVANNTPLVSAIIDRVGFDALEFAIGIGALADTDATFTALVEDGDDPALSDAGAVADGDLLGTEAAASFKFDDDNQVRKIGYRGNRQYVRLTITPATNADTAAIAALAILGGPHLAPVV